MPFQIADSADYTCEKHSKPIEGVESARWYTAKKHVFSKKNQQSHLPAPTIKGLDRYLALERRWWFWVEPVFGEGHYQSTAHAIPQESHFYLARDQQNKNHILILPLCAGDWRAFLHGDEKAMYFGVHGGEKGSQVETEAPLFLITEGKDPLKLIQATMKLLQKRLKTFKLREDKRVPAFTELFGWCTWNAYYQDVSEAKVLRGLEAFRRSGVQPRFMVL
ncbi:MAG: hypothetical protein HRU15_04155, partial [Planctomycetes bacterium]|nr:hypothetical protein [Planctomycetota bacterium]